jgi:(p)ppGpp synthase/HD superfamily hydrolase
MRPELDAMTSVARDYAVLQHGTQLYDGRPYEYHLAAVVNVLERFGHTGPEFRAAAWLHDVVEDTGVAIEDIVASFGPRVGELVWAVTSEPGRNRKERNAATYPKTRATEGGVTLKLADRIANVEHSLKGDGRLLGMYKKEHTAFKEALYVVGESEDMWVYLDGMLD